MKGEVQFRSDKLAVLIDADNTSPSIIEELLKEITQFGTAYVKRIYGDWTSPQMNGWKVVLNDHAIVPIQQFGYTSGKNSTDSALIIDAMDLLYTDTFDCFCIVSSDSDFTRLAHRIRQAGVAVYGFGRKQTPKAFVNSCDRFIHTELLAESSQTYPETIINNNIAKTDNDLKKPIEDAYTILKEAYEAIARDSERVNMGHLGQQLSKLDSSFDSRTYGYKKLGDLLKAVDFFEVADQYVKMKQSE